MTIYVIVCCHPASKLWGVYQAFECQGKATIVAQELKLEGKFSDVVLTSCELEYANEDTQDVA